MITSFPSWHATCLCVGNHMGQEGQAREPIMKQFLTITVFALATLFAGTALAGETAQDISFSDQVCCCKAGCPSGDYFCRFMCQALGGSCSRSASSFPEGAGSTLRNSCMGASWSWWYGVTCPASCPADSSQRP